MEGKQYEGETDFPFENVTVILVSVLFRPLAVARLSMYTKNNMLNTLWLNISWLI
jgi:hypothetical protein